jgi:hypothetical protein
MHSFRSCTHFYRERVRGRYTEDQPNLDETASKSFSCTTNPCRSRMTPNQSQRKSNYDRQLTSYINVTSTILFSTSVIVAMWTIPLFEVEALWKPNSYIRYLKSLLYPYLFSQVSASPVVGRINVAFPTSLKSNWKRSSSTTPVLILIRLAI